MKSSVALLFFLSSTALLLCNAFPSLRTISGDSAPAFNCGTPKTRLACLALKRKCCPDPNGEGDFMCLDSCPMLDEVTEEVYEATYEYVVKILGDGLSVSTAGEPKDWAATWSLKTLDVGLELSVGIDDEDGDAYITVSNEEHSCQLDLGINLNTLEPIVTTMTQNGLICNVEDTVIGDDGQKIITISTETYDDGEFDCRQRLVGAAGLPCIPQALMMTATTKPASCKICEAVYQGYKTIISKENVTVAALENLGQTMCHTFDLFGKTQDQVCDIIINATSEIREAIVKGVTPDGVCDKILSALNITCPRVAIKTKALMELKPTAVMTTTKPASCKICEAVYQGYKTIISKENVTVAALENLGQTMCHTFDFFGKTQDQVCDIIINATSEIREAIVKGVTPDSICGTVLSTLNITCA